MKDIKLYKYIIPLFIIYVFIINCTPTEEHPENPIFGGVKQLYPTFSDGEYNFEAPDNSEYFVLGVFDEPIETLGKTIINTDAWRVGSKTGESGFTRGKVTTTYVYDDNIKDFTGTELSASSGWYWVIWGFDADWNIVSASGEYTIRSP